MALYCRMSGVEAVAEASAGDSAIDSGAASASGAASGSGAGSGIDAAGLKRRRDPIDRQHVRSQAVAHTVLLRKIGYIPEAVDHDLVQSAIDELFIPEKALPVL